MKVWYDFKIAGISMRWLTDEPLILDERYEAFRCDRIEAPEVIYEIKKGIAPIGTVDRRVLFSCEQYRITEDETYRYRTFIYKKHPVMQVVTLIRKRDDGKHWYLYLPKECWTEFHLAKNWSYYMAFEEMFAENKRMLLHASCIDITIGAVLFTGPSGIGKSTQAVLWKMYQNADVINGDRTLLYEQDGILMASGSPCAGTSGIYKNRHAALAAIIVLEQGSENTIEQLKGSSCILPLIRESNFPYMDSNIRDFQLNLYSEVERQIPVYRYTCRNDKSAVDDLYQILKTIGG